MTGRVVVIGDALIDELRDETGVREFVGGRGLNVAVGLSRLGVPASLIAMVGDDDAGEQIRRYLEQYDVELLASPSEHGTSRAVSTRSPGGEPEYVFNDAAQNRRVSYGDAEHAAIAAAPMVVVSCFPSTIASRPTCSWMPRPRRRRPSRSTRTPAAACSTIAPSSSAASRRRHPERCS